MACWAGCAVRDQLERSTSLAPALKSSTNESVGLVGGPALMRNSLIFTWLTFLTFSTAVSDCLARLAAFVHVALPTRSPLKASGPEVTLNVALTLAFGATASGIVFDASAVPATNECHCLLGTEMLKLTPTAGSPVVFVNVTVVSCEDPGENVCSPGGVADAGATLSRDTS